MTDNTPLPSLTQQLADEINANRAMLASLEGEKERADRAASKVNDLAARIDHALDEIGAMDEQTDRQYLIEHIESILLGPDTHRAERRAARQVCKDRHPATNAGGAR